MKPGVVDLEKLRVALRRMSRGNLLMVAERAIEIVPKAKLRALVGDMVRVDELVEGKRGAAPLLDEVRRFHDACLRGEYYESFGVNSKNFMEKSKGTEVFIAELDRLIAKCIRAAVKVRTCRSERHSICFSRFCGVSTTPPTASSSSPTRLGLGK